MSWQKGMFWFAGVFVFSIGYGMVYGGGDAIMVLGTLLMGTALFFKWNNE